MIKPILFNTEMVRAILDERKTVTRRLVKPQPTYGSNTGFSWKGRTYGTDLPSTVKGAAYNFRCVAPYQPGDILYVRETWHGDDECILYKASSHENSKAYIDQYGFVRKIKWKPSIHMPKEVARIWLKVTNVRLKQLRDITNNEAKREGVVVETDNSGTMHRNRFRRIWNSTIKKTDLDRYGWEANPWVWVIEFERCAKPEEEETR